MGGPPGRAFARVLQSLAQFVVKPTVQLGGVVKSWGNPGRDPEEKTANVARGCVTESQAASAMILESAPCGAYTLSLI